MNAHRRWLAPLVVMMFAICVLGVAFLWWRDRSHAWALPRWRQEAFVRLGQPMSLARARELWLVAVNPRCPHCRQHLARALAVRRRTPDVRLAVLLVDTPKPPAATAYADEAVDGLWWDVREVWRRRWGHRVYGEVMVFDREGRLLRTLPPGFEEEALESTPS